jgi:biotin carboxylase
MLINRKTKLINIDKYFNNTYPLFIKPTFGAGSINAYKINNFQELKNKIKFLFNVKSNKRLMYDTLLLQEYIEGEQYIINFYTYNGHPYFTDA